MKKHLYVLIITALIFAGFSYYHPHEISGTWHIKKMIAYMPYLSPDLIKAAEEEALSSVYSFQSDTVFQMHSNYVSTPEGGTYQIISDKTLKMTYRSHGKQNREEYQIVYLKNDSMVWRQTIVDFGSVEMVLKRE